MNTGLAGSSEAVSRGRDGFFCSLLTIVNATAAEVGEMPKEFGEQPNHLCGQGATAPVLLRLDRREDPCQPLVQVLDATSPDGVI